MKFSQAFSFLAMTASPVLGSTVRTWDGFGSSWKHTAFNAADLSTMSYFVGDGFDVSYFSGRDPIKEWDSGVGSEAGSKVLYAWINNQVYVVFPGMEDCQATFLGQPIDGLTDFDCINKGLNDFRNSGETIIEGCKFNDYITKAYKDDWSFVSSFYQKLEDMLDFCENGSSSHGGYGEGNCEIVYAGHSAGGARAMAAAMEMSENMGGVYSQPENVSIFTFGQPPTFAEECAALVQFEDKMYRFVSIVSLYDFVKQDFAPGLGSGWDHMGNTVFISDGAEDYISIKNVKLHYPEESPNYQTGPDKFGAFDFWKMAKLEAHKVTVYRDLVSEIDTDQCLRSRKKCALGKCVWLCVEHGVRAEGLWTEQLCTHDSQCMKGNCGNRDRCVE